VWSGSSLSTPRRNLLASSCSLMMKAAGSVGEPLTKPYGITFQQTAAYIVNRSDVTCTFSSAPRDVTVSQLILSPFLGSNLFYSLVFTSLLLCFAVWNCSRQAACLFRMCQTAWQHAELAPHWTGTSKGMMETSAQEEPNSTDISVQPFAQSARRSCV